DRRDRAPGRRRGAGRQRASPRGVSGRGVTEGSATAPSRLTDFAAGPPPPSPDRIAPPVSRPPGPAAGEKGAIDDALAQAGEAYRTAPPSCGAARRPAAEPLGPGARRRCFDRFGALDTGVDHRSVQALHSHHGEPEPAGGDRVAV